MVMGGLALAAGGAQLLSNYMGQRAANREQQYSRDLQKKKQRFLRPAMGQLKRFGKDLQRLPGILRRSREGRMASMAQEMHERIGRRLGQAGVTSGSAMAGQEARRGQFGMEQARAGEMIGEQQAIAGMRGQHIGLSGQLSNMLYPGAGQLAQGAGQQTYMDFEGPISTAMLLNELMGNGGATGSNPMTTIPNAPRIGTRDHLFNYGYP